VPGEGFWEVGGHRPQLDFWPFDHKPARTVLRRRGVPFWDVLDAAGVPSTFYDLPSNYPASPSHYGHHRCLCGMGTPDMLGTYGTYQHFAENGPAQTIDEGGGKRSRLSFEGETARARIIGPDDTQLQTPRPIPVEFLVHRDREANSALLEVQGRKILLKAGQWSRWTRLNFELSMPAGLPGSTFHGICRFYLQEVAPNFRLYVSPINIDPANPAQPISEPGSFVRDVAGKLGPFYTTGFQEDHKARTSGVFSYDEFARQAALVLDERLALLDYAIHNYDDGLLFFYFSSSDLQSHIFWWDSDAKHPIRGGAEARAQFRHVQTLYQKLDAVIGELIHRYGAHATIFVMSDHGFANFGSLGIMLGGMGAMVPERRDEVVALGLRSILSGTLATCMSGAVAGWLVR
jgi:hypothetical protein